MRGVNRVMLIGNLGKDPDVQFLEGNIAVAKFPLATTETFKDRSGKLVSQTEWHTVVLWRGLAELAQKYLHKSSLVYIEGRLRTREKASGKDGYGSGRSRAGGNCTARRSLSHGDRMAHRRRRRFGPRAPTPRPPRRRAARSSSESSRCGSALSQPRQGTW